MPRVMRMPEVAANTTEAVLAEWAVGENAEFGALDTVATVETDKAVVDVEADEAGVVLKTLVPPGTQVEVGAPIAVLGAPGEQVDDLDALLVELGVATAVEPVVPQRREVPDDPGSTGPAAQAEANGPTNGHRRVFASPLARKLAKEAEIPVEEIDGTGPRNRVLRRDVERAIASRAAAAPPVAVSAERGPSRPAAGVGAGYEEVPHSRIRRATARRLQESVTQAPHFYVRAVLRAERLLALRAEINEDSPVRVSVNDLILKAVAAAHQRVPDMNVTWTDDAVRRWQAADVAVAVATDRGLVTPVVRDVGSLSVTAVAARVQELAAQAREGRLRQEDLEGGSMSVSNLGMYGTEEFAAIINPPHAGILAVGAVREEPVVTDGAVVPGTVMTVTLSVDHRPVDGVVAARWLAAFQELIEHPARILA